MAKKKPKKTRVIPTIRVSPDEDEALRWAAGREGQPLGRWLRELGLARAETIRGLEATLGADDE